MKDQSAFLRAFCATREAVLASVFRAPFRNPFSFDRFTFATDGIIAIRVPRIAGIPDDEENGRKVGGIGYPDPARCTFGLPEIPPKELVPCAEMLAMVAERCSSDCPECGGLGRVAKPKRVEIGLCGYNSEYLRKMRMFLRNVRTDRPATPAQMLSFVFDGDGAGVLMYLKPPPVASNSLPE